MKKFKTKISGALIISIALLTSLTFSACDIFSDTTTMSGTTEDGVKLTFNAMLYDNRGNNYLTVKGNTFDIKPNKIAQHGYDSDGNYVKYYETSSIVSVTIDGHKIDTCGSTILFKDTRIEMIPLDADIGSISENNVDYTTLSKWYKNDHADSDTKQLVLIQSQDGYNIGVCKAKNIDWEVCEKLPKTTRLDIDGKELYIHRCNFTVIDISLLDKAVN